VGAWQTLLRISVSQRRREKATSFKKVDANSTCFEHLQSIVIGVAVLDDYAFNAGVD
jgi:hypothetical protein